MIENLTNSKRQIVCYLYNYKSVSGNIYMKEDNYYYTERGPQKALL